MDISEKISAWLYAKSELATIQEVERNLRAEILEECFGEGNIGTTNCVKDGYMIKGSYGLSYSLNQADIAAAYEEGVELPNCIRIKYDLDKRAYDALDEIDTVLIDGYLTVKPSLPTLEIKPITE